MKTKWRPDGKALEECREHGRKIAREWHCNRSQKLRHRHHKSKRTQHLKYLLLNLWLNLRPNQLHLAATALRLSHRTTPLQAVNKNRFAPYASGFTIQSKVSRTKTLHRAPLGLTYLIISSALIAASVKKFLNLLPEDISHG